MENKIYDVLELQKMSTIDLTSLAETFDVSIQSNFKQSLIYAILDRQQELSHKPSELHSRDRYAVAERIRVAVKMVVIVLMLSGYASCATQRPGSASLHRAVKITQQIQQYEHSRPACKDGGRIYRNQQRSNAKMTRIPFTNLYIF